MNPKHLALVLLVASGTVVAGIGLVSAGHKPTNPDDTYTHVVDQVLQSKGGCVQVDDTEVNNLNKVTIQGWTNHFNTTFYHDDGQQDIRVHVPELLVPTSSKIVLFSNEENPTIETLANGPLEGSCAEVNVTGTLVIGEYNINVGDIRLPQGVEVVAGSEVGDNAPAPGDGNPAVSTTSGLGVLGSSTSQSSTSGTDDSALSATQPAPNLDRTGDGTDGATDSVDSPASVEDPTAPGDGTVDNTTSSVTAVVDQVRESVTSALTADSPTGVTATDGTAVAGAFGLTGTVGLLLALVRHRRR